MSATRAFAETRRVSSGWRPSAAHEQQARDAASSRTASATGRGASLRTEEAPGVTGAGRPLPSGDRDRMEGRFGRDFSGVRVHTDSSAADAIGAKAFAYGKDIVFGPGQYDPQSKSGGELLTHELAHIAQQADQGAAAIQKQPKDNDGKQGGIGSHPPAEPFLKGTEVSIEDASVLFDLDQARLTPASQKAILQAIGKHKGPVTVEIDGYASSEGQGEAMADYNLNLSAHRAAAVKAFLLGKLPAGSKFTLVAHGETTDFAPLEQNRRVGFTIRDGVDTADAAAKKPEDYPRSGTAAPSPFGPIVLNPKIVADRYAGSTSPLAPFLPAQPGPYLIPPLGKVPTYGDIDWESLHNKATDHGLKLDDSLAGSLERNFSYGYHFFLPFLGHDGAVSASNFATGFAFGNWLTAENPNAFDRFNLQFQQAYPNEKHLVIPLGSDTLDWIRMKWKGNKKDDYFFRF